MRKRVRRRMVVTVVVVWRGKGVVSANAILLRIVVGMMLVGVVTEVMKG